MPRILSLHREEVDLGLETLKFQCVIGADPLLLVLLGREAWYSMVGSYRSSTLSTRPEGEKEESTTVSLKDILLMTCRL